MRPLFVGCFITLFSAAAFSPNNYETINDGIIIHLKSADNKIVWITKTKLNVLAADHPERKTIIYSGQQLTIKQQ